MSEASNGASVVECPLVEGTACLMPESVSDEIFSSVSTLPNPGRDGLPLLTGVVDPEDSGVIAAGAIVVLCCKVGSLR